MSMKKSRLICWLLLLTAYWASAEEAKRISPQLELVSGVGLSYGQLVSLTPQAVFLGEYESGWAFGPGFGLRSGLVTVSYMKVVNPNYPDERKIQFETDLALFYRLRYSSGRFFGAIDLGAALGLLSHYHYQWSVGYRSPDYRCRTQGPFVEPQAGIHLGRFSLALGAMIYPSDYSLSEWQGDIISTERIDDDCAFALNLHFTYSF